MCGIIGYLGDDNFTEYVFAGLKLIQNRGYDSIGVAYIEGNTIQCVKRASTVNTSNAIELVEGIIEKSSVNSGTAIGHTRWATHGGKTDLNAHPHLDHYGNIAIVHNGIIENYLEIKETLLSKGIKFISQTDTEVIASLIGYYYHMGYSIKDSIAVATKQLSGTWALVMVCKQEPNKIWVTRNGSPILLGLDQNFAMVVSEQSAFSNYITKFIPIDNHDIIEIKLEDGRISYSTNICESKIVSKTMQDIDLSPFPFKYWMEKEILSQPDSINNAINNGGRLSRDDSVKLGGLDTHKEQLLKIEHLILLGCGTSYNSGHWSIALFKSFSIFKSVTMYDGAEFTENDIPDGICGFVLLSQSGETRDLIACLDIAKSKSIITIGIVNVVDSFIARETTCGVYLNAGREHAVASTKSFTNQCIVLALTAVWFAQNKNLHAEKRKQIINDIRMLPLHMENVLNKDSHVDELLVHFDFSQSCFILGKGSNQAIACEGSLKLKEIAYIHAEGFSSSALKHGPFALIVQDVPIFIIDIDHVHHDKNMNAFHEVTARGANPIVISCFPNAHLTIDNNNTFGGILVNIYFQLIALKVAILKGHNPDFPRNLAKVVTVD